MKKIKSDDRVTAFGATGTGKTTLMKELTRDLKRLVVFDTKGSLDDWNTIEWNEGRKRFLRGESMRLRIVPPLGVDETEFWDAFLWICFDVGDLTIYADELYSLSSESGRASRILKNVYTRGREFGIGMWASAQRPSLIPLFAISESNHLFIFRLNMEEDRRRLASFAGDRVMNPIRDPHGFYHYVVTDDQATYYKTFQKKEVMNT